MFIFFFFNDPATTEIYTLSLHDALPIYPLLAGRGAAQHVQAVANHRVLDLAQVDRKSTRLNSSLSQISYAVFCLKKKKNALWNGRLNHQRFVVRRNPYLMLGSGKNLLYSNSYFVRIRKAFHYFH